MNEDILFRPPTSKDAIPMRDLARQSGVLSVNSIYYYALMARHFQATGMVADCHGEICGYITGYNPPGQNDALFIWQVGVANKWQGKGIGQKLLISLIKATRLSYLEATIAPDNQASINLFKSVAHHFGAGLIYSKTPFFGDDDFASKETPERLMRIGPITLK